MLTTAGLQTGSAVLEVGCGTGQLTEQLALFGFDLTAIDIGPSMIAGARRRIGDREVSLRNVAFEDFERPGVSFDMVVSATAFQWVDPEVKFTKPVARRPDDPRCDNQPPPLPFSARIVHHTAIRAVVASVRAREPAAPGSVKLTKWIPTRISAPLSWPRADAADPFGCHVDDVTWGRVVHRRELHAGTNVDLSQALQQLRCAAFDQAGRAVNDHVVGHAHRVCALGLDREGDPRVGAMFAIFRPAPRCPITMSSPSRPVHTTLTWGLPSGLMVARWASRPAVSARRRSSVRVTMRG